LKAVNTAGSLVYKLNNMIQHQISLQQAIEYTTRFRENPGVDMPYSETFSADSVRALLAQNGSHSFRIYLGRKADNRICSVLVAVNESGHDILPLTSNTRETDDDGIILEDAFQCPPVCPPPSPLNE
jgi:hypothetical protein